MNDPDIYPHADILRNFANIRDENELSCMEAEYTSIRLAELVTKESVSRFDFTALCNMHYGGIMLKGREGFLVDTILTLSQSAIL